MSNLPKNLTMLADALLVPYERERSGDFDAEALAETVRQTIFAAADEMKKQSIEKEALAESCANIMLPIVVEYSMNHSKPKEAVNG
jgi:hypothetical protein